MASPELNRLVFEQLDRTTLTRCMRTKKAWMYDVAQVLYKEVDFGLVQKMTRTSVRQTFTLQCFAV